MGFGSTTNVPDNARQVISRTLLDQSLKPTPYPKVSQVLTRDTEVNGRYVSNVLGNASRSTDHIPHTTDSHSLEHSLATLPNSEQIRPIIRPAQTGDFPPLRTPPTFKAHLPEQVHFTRAQIQEGCQSSQGISSMCWDYAISPPFDPTTPPPTVPLMRPNIAITRATGESSFVRGFGEGFNPVTGKGYSPPSPDQPSGINQSELSGIEEGTSEQPSDVSLASRYLDSDSQAGSNVLASPIQASVPVSTFNIPRTPIDPQSCSIHMLGTSLSSLPPIGPVAYTSTTTSRPIITSFEVPTTSTNSESVHVSSHGATLSSIYPTGCVISTAYETHGTNLRPQSHSGSTTSEDVRVPTNCYGPQVCPDYVEHTVTEAPVLSAPQLYTDNQVLASSQASGTSSNFLAHSGPLSSCQSNNPVSQDPHSFDWQRMESMFTHALEGVLARTQREQASVASNSQHRASVTFSDPITSSSRPDAPAESQVGYFPAASNVCPTYTLSSPASQHTTGNVESSDSNTLPNNQVLAVAREVARILRADSQAAVGNNRGHRSPSSSDSESGSSSSSSSRSHGNRRSRGSSQDFLHSRHRSTGQAVLTDQDITVLTRQGISKGVLKGRQQQQHSLNITRVEELPDIPSTQFVVQMSADSVPKFSGNMEDYELFKELFLAFAQALPASQRLVNLKLKLDQNSQNAIAGCIGQDKVSFETAFGILDARNNKKDLLINILISKIDAYFEREYEDDDLFINMVSKVQSLYNRILSIDPLQLTTLNGLTTRFSRCLPDKPYGRVSNLMGKFTHEGVSKYNFQRVLRICEKHVDWLNNQTANFRATGRRRGSSKGRHQSHSNSSKDRYGPNFGQRRGQAVYTAASQESEESLNSDINNDIELVDHVDAASTREIVGTGNSATRSRGRSRQRPMTTDTNNSSKHAGRTRSLSRARKVLCTLCSAEDHIPRDCPTPPANLLEFVDSQRLCRVCLLCGHYAHECPIKLYCPSDNVICKSADCDQRPHAVVLCNALKNK